MPARRFRVSAGALAAAPAGTTIALSEEEARHLRVMRLKSGDAVELFDGAGQVATGVVVDPTVDRVGIRVDAARAATVESPVAVTLIQAVPVKPQRLDTTVRLCTELGVARIVPVVSEHSQGPGGHEALQRRVGRWGRIAEAAAKQSGRSVVPSVADVMPLGQLDWDELPSARWVLEPRAGRSLVEAVAGEPHERCVLFVGPEGGWSSDEVEMLIGQNADLVGLGPRVLRADSAGPVALALIQAAWGDLA